MSKEYVTFECVHTVDTDMNDPDENKAIAYADIDGYTANEKGTVICRVWLLREPAGRMKEQEFIVDWHYNAYRENEKVLELIRKAKCDLKVHLTQIVRDIFNKAYDRYKLKWMFENNHSLSELLGYLQNQLDDPNGVENVFEACNLLETTDGFAENVYDIWSGKEMFKTDEWNDESYMRQLLCDGYYAIWCRWKHLV